MCDDLPHLESELSLTERGGAARGQLVGTKAKLEALRLRLPAVERGERGEREDRGDSRNEKERVARYERAEI